MARSRAFKNWRHIVLMRLGRFLHRRRGSKILNVLIRAPIGFVHELFFFVRNACLGPRCTLPLAGYSLVVDLRDRSLSQHLYLYGGYERNETSLMRAIVKPGFTVVDVGANIGYYTILFSKLVGSDGTVIAIEPEPRNYQLLRENISRNVSDNVIALEAAAADRAGKLTLILSHRSLGGHHIAEGARVPACRWGRHVDVTSVAVDDVLEERSLRPALIKMDIEGSELLAVRGLKRTLSRNQGIVLLCEFNPMAQQRCGADPEAFLDEFEEMGFAFFEIREACQLRRMTRAELVERIPGGRHINLLICRFPPAGCVVTRP